MATTRNLTILLTDIKGFTDKTSHKSRADIDAMLAEHREIVLPALEDRGGRLLKTIGDAFLMTFDSPTNAVLAGVAVQEALSRRNEGRVGEDRLEVRIAINVGEVNITDSDVFGEPVNITARIEGIAEAGEVFFTEAVYLAMNKAEVPSSEVGKFKLKGIEGEFKVYKVRRETPLSGTTVPALQAVGSGKVIEVGDPAPKAWAVGSRSAVTAVVGASPAPAGPESAEARKARRRGLWRRGAATALDVLICSMVAGMLASDDVETVEFKFRTPPAAPAAAEGAPRTLVDDEDAQVTLGATGLHVKDKDGGDEVHVGPQGLTVKEKGKASVNITLPASLGREVSEVLSDDGRTQVSTRRKRKSGKDKLFPFIWVALNMLALTAWMTTPGKKVMGFKVVRHEDGATPDWKTYLMRTVLTFVSVTPAGLGYVWAWWEKDGRGWHDLLAGTRVVRVEAPAKSA